MAYVFGFLSDKTSGSNNLVFTKISSNPAPSSSCAHPKEECLPGSDRTISLPDDEPGMVQMYVALTYSVVMTPKDWLIKFGDLAGIYVLVEKLQDTSAKTT